MQASNVKFTHSPYQGFGVVRRHLSAIRVVDNAYEGMLGLLVLSSRYDDEALSGLLGQIARVIRVIWAVTWGFIHRFRVLS